MSNRYKEFDETLQQFESSQAKAEFGFWLFWIVIAATIGWGVVALVFC